MSNWLMSKFISEKFSKENLNYEVKVRSEKVPRLKWLENDEYCYEEVNTQDEVNQQNYTSYKTLSEAAGCAISEFAADKTDFVDMSYIDLTSKSRTLQKLTDKKVKEFVQKNAAKYSEQLKEFEKSKKVVKTDTDGPNSKE